MLLMLRYAAFDAMLMLIARADMFSSMRCPAGSRRYADAALRERFSR